MESLRLTRSQMSEEIQNASKIVPRAMISSMLLNGVLGFGMLIAVLFCLGDITAALESPTGYPFMEIFLQATGNSVSGSTVMIAIVTIMGTLSIPGFLATSSRAIWAFSRDRGLPFWQPLSKVSHMNISSQELTLTQKIRFIHVHPYPWCPFSPLRP